MCHISIKTNKLQAANILLEGELPCLLKTSFKSQSRQRTTKRKRKRKEEIMNSLIGHEREEDKKGRAEFIRAFTWVSQKHQTTCILLQYIVL